MVHCNEIASSECYLSLRMADNWSLVICQLSASTATSLASPFIQILRFLTMWTDFLLINWSQVLEKKLHRPFSPYSHQRGEIGSEITRGYATRDLLVSSQPHTALLPTLQLPPLEIKSENFRGNKYYVKESDGQNSAFRSKNWAWKLTF
jgi:hypothetical protein